MTDYTKLIERLRDNTARHDDESRRLCNEAAEAIEALHKEVSTLDVLLEECKMDWSGDVTQLKAEHKHEIDALQSKLGDAIRSLANWQHQCTELQAENERLKVESTNKNDWLVEQRKWEAHANALQAKLDAMGKGEPVAHRAWFDADNGARWLFTLWPEEEKLDVEWEPLFAAPKALAPLTDERIDELAVTALTDYREGRNNDHERAFARAIEAAHGIGGTP